MERGALRIVAFSRDYLPPSQPPTEEVAMPTPITNFRLPEPLLTRIDAARGPETRTSFLIRALEAQIDREGPARPVLACPVTSAEVKAGVRLR